MEVKEGYFQVEVEDASNRVIPNRISTLKLKVTNRSKIVFRNVYLCPLKRYFDVKSVCCTIDGLKVIWGGGKSEGYKLMTPSDLSELKPGDSVNAYFLLHYPFRKEAKVKLRLSLRNARGELSEVEVPITVESNGMKEFLYRPRYKPVLNESLLNRVEGILKDYGVPEVQTFIWQLFPKVHVLLDGREIALITGDVGSGLGHASKVNIKEDLFVGFLRDPKGAGNWYWVVRVWFFWLSKSLFDEVPDAERVELWVNPDTFKVDWLITDRHWREVVFKGPVERAKVKIVGGSFTHLDRIFRSYHPPIPIGMKQVYVSPDSRDPRSDIKSIYFV